MADSHGGGAFSGKDPTKVDGSVAYICRFVARQFVKEGIARRAELQVSYAIGRAQPVSVLVETFGTGDAERAGAYVSERFDFRPRAIIERLRLPMPLYRSMTNYGHFGKPWLPREQQGRSTSMLRPTGRSWPRTVALHRDSAHPPCTSYPCGC